MIDSEPLPSPSAILVAAGVEATCANCGEPILASFVDRDGYVVWAHHTHDMHTVCNWHEDMAPTSVVATPS